MREEAQVECNVGINEAEENAIVARAFYSIRAKFYDRYNIKHSCPYTLEKLIFDKLSELEGDINPT
jgi:hypothetical protein